MKPELCRTLLLISGMRSNQCRELVALALWRIVGVTDVQVNLFRAQAMVTHEPSCTITELMNAVSATGCGAIAKKS